MRASASGHTRGLQTSLRFQQQALERQQTDDDLDFIAPHQGLDLEAMAEARGLDDSNENNSYFTTEELYSLLESLVKFLHTVRPMYDRLAAEVSSLQETYESVQDKLRKIDHQDTTRERREEARKALAKFSKSGVTKARQVAVGVLLAATRESMVGGIIQDFDIVWNTRPLRPEHSSLGEALLVIHECLGKLYKSMSNSEASAKVWLEQTRMELLTEAMDRRALDDAILNLRNWRAGALTVAAELVILPVKVQTLLAALQSKYGAKANLSGQLRGLLDDVVRKITNNLPDSDRDVCD
eukprot:Colp12_sorted_trinity150504_noHs@18659